MHTVAVGEQSLVKMSTACQIGGARACAIQQPFCWQRGHMLRPSWVTRRQINDGGTKSTLRVENAAILGSKAENRMQDQQPPLPSLASFKPRNQENTVLIVETRVGRLIVSFKNHGLRGTTYHVIWS
jgi:hypothetical protein